MKRFILISCLLVSGLVSLAEDPAPKAEESEPGDAPKVADAQDGITEARLKKVKNLPITAKQIMELQTTGTLKDATYTLDASVSVSLPRDAKGKQKALAKYTKSGKVPFKIYTHVQVSVPGKKKTLYTKDKASICIIDKDNNIVLRKNEALIKLCSTWGGGGGLFGEESSGKYIVVIWLNLDKETMIGKAFETELTIQ